jgi:hypothetical protein
MHKIVAALLLTLSLLVGQDGFELGPDFLSPDTMPVLVDVSNGGSQRDIGGTPVHLCTRLSCTQTLSVPERLVLTSRAHERSRFAPGNDLGPHSTALQQDPPVPRMWVG